MSSDSTGAFEQLLSGEFDGVAAVGAVRGAVAAAEDLEIDAVALLAEAGEAEGRGAVEAGGDHLVGQRLGHRLHHRVEHAIGRDHARAHRRGRARVEQRAVRHLDADRPRHAFVVGNVGAGQHRLHAGQRGRERARVGAVEVALDLAAGAFEVDLDRVLGDRHLGLDHQRIVGEAVVVDRVLAVEGALGRLGDRGAHAALGVVLHLLHRGLDLVDCRSARRAASPAARRSRWRRTGR